MTPSQLPPNPFTSTVPQLLPPQKANVAVFWAYKGMEVPPSTGATKAIEKLISLGSPYGRVQSISVYSTPYTIPLTIGTEFKNLSVKCLENHEDPIVAMMTDMLLFAVDNKNDAAMVVVCSSPKLNPVISSLRSRGYEMILVHKTTFTGLPLTTSAVTWQEIMGEANFVEHQLVEPSTSGTLWSQVAKGFPTSTFSDHRPLLEPSPLAQATAFPLGLEYDSIARPTSLAARQVTPTVSTSEKRTAPTTYSAQQTLDNQRPDIKEEHLAQFLDICLELAGPYSGGEMVPIPATTVGIELFKKYPDFPRGIKLRYFAMEGYNHGRCVAVEGSGPAWVIQIFPSAITKFLARRKIS